MIVVLTLRLLAVGCLIISDYNVKAEFSCSAQDTKRTYVVYLHLPNRTETTLGGEVIPPHLVSSGCDRPDGASDDINAVNSALGIEWTCLRPFDVRRDAHGYPEKSYNGGSSTLPVSTGQGSVGLSVGASLCPTEIASLNDAAGTSFTCSDYDVVVREPDDQPDDQSHYQLDGQPYGRTEKRTGFAIEGCTTENLIKLAYFTEAEKERASYFIFYIIVSVLICCLVTCNRFCCNPGCCSTVEDAEPNRSANLMRLIFVIRSYDMCSDWAFFSISLRKGGLFALVYIADGGDHGALWAVSLTFCILGTILYFPDIRMLYKRTKPQEIRTGDGADHFRDRERHRATESDVRRATIISVLSFSFLPSCVSCWFCLGLCLVWGGALHKEMVYRRGIILHCHRPRRQNCYNGSTLG